MAKSITLYIDTLPIQELYDSGMTSYEIAEKFKISQYAVWRRIKNPRRAVSREHKKYTKGKFGKKSPTYKNGSGIYKREFLKDRELICFECGTWDNVIVHHIDHNRKNNDPNNLMPLCRPCHSKEHEIINNIRWMQ